MAVTFLRDCSRSDSVSDVFGSDSQCSCPEYGDQGSHSLHFDDNEMEDFAMDDEYVLNPPNHSYDGLKGIEYRFSRTKKFTSVRG